MKKFPLVILNIGEVISCASKRSGMTVTYKKNKNIVLRNIHNTFFLIDITDNYSGDKCILNETNEVGAFIWNELSEKTSIEDIVDKLKSLLNEEVSRDAIYSDIQEYIHYLKHSGFVEESDS